MIRKTLSFFCFLALTILLVLGLTSCNSNNSQPDNSTKEIYMNETGSWSNGVEFSIYNHKETSELDFGLYKYTTNDKFLVIGLRVYNGSSETFSADGTDVWLLLNDTKIYQQNIAERHVQGYDDISQSPTVTKEYFLFFEIGNNVSMSDLKLVINNGGFIDSESVIIKLKNAPKDSTVNLNYAYDDKTEIYNFYSGTSIVPSNFPTPYREGYKFSGWYFNDDYSGSPLDSLILEQNQTITLYAKWDVINVNIIYNGNGNSSGQTESQVAQIGTSITIKENSYIKDGFYFVGWTESVGSNEIISPNTIYNLTLSEKDITLYAKWAKDIYSVDDFNSINENNDCVFVLKNDIDFNGTNANTITIFNGTLEGNYFTIKNSTTPLFIENNGVIENIVVENCELSKFDNYLYNASSVTENDITFNCAYGGLVAINRGTIKNSLVNLSINKDFPAEITSCLGGIVAINEGGSIICCKSNLSATHNAIGKSLNWGGIAGISSNSVKKGVIENCYSAGTLDLPQKGDKNSSHELIVGGILGFGTNITIRNSLSIIDMNIAMNYTSFKNIGGILGQSGYGNVVIDSCATIGDINCLDVGIVYVGGIACDSSFAYTTQNCYSNSSITLMYNTSFYVENGTRVSSDSFLQADFYSTKNILTLFIDEENLKANENAVWCVNDGALPYLYWEK